jgi:hypothetical protein
MLSKKHLQDVCLYYDGTYKKCRYLGQDDNDWNKYYCAKKSSKKAEIDVETEDFIRETKKKGKDPLKENIPLGDNCAGYPIMKFIEQGYDKP